MHYTTDTEINNCFKREAKTLAALNHPNIITVSEIGEQQGDALCAIENYEKFLDLWKNADADLPDLIDPEASGRYTRLTGE